MISNLNKILLIFFLLINTQSCGIYSFTGASIPPGVTTFQVNFFENLAGNRPGSTVEPGLDNDFTNALQDIIINQTNLNLVSEGGELIYEGEITKYSVTPMAATAEITAAQNRLEMSVDFRFFNIKKEDDDFEKKYSFFMLKNLKSTDISRRFCAAVIFAVAAIGVTLYFVISPS